MNAVRAVFLSVGVLVVIGAAAAPWMLLHSTPARQADAVVLFVGTEREARKRRAEDLLENGLASLLIVPAFGRVANPQWAVSGVSFPVREGFQNPALEHVEGSHKEMLAAREIMDALGLTSALFVSSPYHMRRLHLIAGRVFKESGVWIAFVPSRHENPRPGTWFLHWYDAKWVFSEWAKILWFWIYEPFLQSDLKIAN